MKIFKRILLAIGILVLILILGLALYNVTALRIFYTTENHDFLHPGIYNLDYDQQGFAQDEESGLFLYSGYMKDSSANPVYFLEPQSGDIVKTVYLSNDDGTPFQGHAGGIVTNGDFFYVAGSRDECLYVFSRDELFSAEDGGSIRCIGVFPTRLSEEDGSRVSFISKDENRLYVGEFYLACIPRYWLRSNHTITGENGTTHAMMFGFDFDENAEFGLCSRPSVAYALPDKVQHAVFSGENLVLSRSYFFLPSVIEGTEPVRAGTFTIMGAEVPLYALNSIGRQYAIPMTEGIVVYNNRVYLSTELYNFKISGIGKLWDAKWCYSIPLSSIT